jgi:hypothetical protein
MLGCYYQQLAIVMMLLNAAQVRRCRAVGTVALLALLGPLSVMQQQQQWARVAASRISGSFGPKRRWMFSSVCASLLSIIVIHVSIRVPFCSSFVSVLALTTNSGVLMCCSYMFFLVPAGYVDAVFGLVAVREECQSTSHAGHTEQQQQQ